KSRMSKDYDKLSREELLAELSRTDSAREGKALHDLHVHQEELRAQNEELVETHRSLEESRSRYLELFEHAPIGYVMTDAAGTIVGLNHTGAQLLANQRDALIGFSLGRFVRSEERDLLVDHLARARSQGESSCELALRTQSGREVPV